MRAAYVLLVLCLACAAAPTDQECRKWQREGCAYLQRCGQVSDVEACIAEREALADSLKPCGAALADPYCNDYSDDFTRCTEEVKKATCADVDAGSTCTIQASSRTKCTYRWTVKLTP